MDEFEAIVSGQFDDIQAPTVDERKDGLYFLAISEDITVYEVVLVGRVILHVRVNHIETVEVPKLFKGRIHPAATCDRILVARPDGGALVPTDGVAIMGKCYLNRESVTLYVLPRLSRLLVKVYALGL